MTRSLFWTEAFNRWIDALHWRVFEFVTADIFKADGWTVKEITQQSRDGGYDIHMTRDGESRLTDAKNWNGPLTKPDVQEILDRLDMEHDLSKYDSFAIATTGTVTKPARRYAATVTANREFRVRLYDGDELHRLIKQHELYDLPARHKTPVPEPDVKASNALTW